MEPTTSERPRVTRERVNAALRKRGNWEQLAKFCVVGASGYVVNLAVYAALLKGAGFHYAPAATCSFLVAASSNYTLNRLWTFRAERGRVHTQGARFFVVSAVVYLANLGLLTGFVALGVDKILAQAIAVVLVTPLNFVGNKLWSFRRH
jgi:dolichol-phosphate mannosyltransferase